MSWSRGRSGRAAVVAAAAVLLVGCASTVSGTAVGVDGGARAPATETVDPGSSTGAPDTGGSGTSVDTAGPDNSVPGPSSGPIETTPATSAPTTAPFPPGGTTPGGTTPGGTTPDAPSPTASEEHTAPSSAADTPTAPSTAAKNTAPTGPEEPRGVPDPAPNALRKDIGEHAGVAAPSGDVTFDFTVDAIDPGYADRCPGKLAEPDGLLIGVKITFSVEQAYQPADGALQFSHQWFSVIGADGRAHKDVGGPDIIPCPDDTALTADKLQPGQSGSGWIVLDSAVRYGVISLTQDNLQGSWEWIIPGSR